MLASVVVSFNSNGQCDPVLLPDSSQFYVGNTNGLGNVYTAISNGNSVYLGGDFTYIGKRTSSFMGVDTITGNPVKLGTWPQINSGGIVNKIIADGSGGWIVGGSFSQIGGIARNNIARVNAAGQVTSWNPNANGGVVAIAISGTTVYLAGAFTSIGGQFRNHIGAVDINTGVYTSWNPNSDAWTGSIAITSTTIYIAGNFSTVAGQSRNRIAAFDISTGNLTAWNPNMGSSSSGVYSIAISSNTVYAGGDFTTVGALTRNRIAAIDATTGIATSWNPNCNGTVLSLLINGNNLILGGAFSTIGGQSRSRLAQVDLSTGFTTAFDANVGAGSVVDMLINGSSLYIAGDFTSVSSTTVERYGLAKIDVNTAALSNWECHSNGLVNTVLLSGTTLLTGGNFSCIGHKRRRHAAAVDIVSDTVLPWRPVIATGGPVASMLYNAGKVYLGGASIVVGGGTNYGLACVDATTGALTSSFSANISQMQNGVLDMAYYSGLLYICGDFSAVNGTTRSYVAAVDANTGVLSSWYPQPDGLVDVMDISGSTIFIGGNFQTIAGQPRSRIAAIDAMGAGVPTSWSAGADARVRDITISGNNVFVSGNFQYIGGYSRSKLAKIDVNTATVSTWYPSPNNDVWQSFSYGPNLYTWGTFTTVNGIAKNYFAVLDTVSNNPGSWNPGFQQPSGLYNIFVGGDKIYMTQPILNLYKIQSSVSSVSITGNAFPCPGSSQTYTATTPVTGASFQWKVNGINAGGNSNAYTYTPITGDIITCEITIPVGSCFTTTTATSNAITIATLSPTPGSVSITTPNTTICSGTSVTYTATTNVTGATYQWQVNNANVGTSTATYSYTPANNDQVKCIVTVPSTGCFTANQVTSNVITMTVNTTATPTVSIAVSANPACSGTSVNFTATSNVTGVSYQWKVNNVNVGTNSNTYAYTPLNGDVVTCVTTTAVGACVTATNATSNAITMTITANTTGTGSVAASANPVCASTSVIYTATTNIPGANYQWQVNAANVGTNSNTYAYTPTNGNTVTCTITPATSTCYTSVTTNAVTMTVNTTTAPTASIAASSNPSCTGASVTYTATTNVTGATYQWQVNNANVGTSTATYNYTPANNDQVKCIVTVPTAGCFTASQVTSNVITMTVSSSITPTVSIAASVNPACASTSVSFTATSNITGVSYQWKVNSLNVGTNSNTYAYTPLNGDVVTCVTTTPVGSCVTTTTATSNAVTMTMTANAVGTGSIVASTNPVCAGTSVTYTATTNIPGANYQWQVNSANVGTNSNTYTYTPTNGNAINCIVTATAGTCFTGANTNTIFMTVNPIVTPTLVVAASSNPACNGSTVNFTATSNVTGVTNQWQVNSTNAGSNASTYSYVPANNDHVTCIATMPATGCYSTNTITSNMVTMTMTAPAPTTASITASANNICAGVSVNFTATTNITNANYQWKVNSVAVGANQNTYSNVPNNGDVVTCDVSLPATGGCFSPASLTSNALTMTVTPNVTPTISITAPNHVPVGTTVNLTAVITNAPASYNIDWKKNSVVFATTTVPNTSYTKAAGTDVIDATITATAGCYTPANATAVNVQDNVGVPGIGKNSQINIYPNPFSEKITITGLQADYKIQLFDLAGRLLHQWQTDNAAAEQSFLINDIANGSYFVKVLDANGAIKGVGTLKKL